MAVNQKSKYIVLQNNDIVDEINIHIFLFNFLMNDHR